MINEEDSYIVRCLQMMETRENHEVGIFFFVEINARKSLFSLNSLLRSISEKPLIFFFQLETTNTNAKSTVYLMRKTSHYACSTRTPFTHSLHAQLGIYSLHVSSSRQVPGSSRVPNIFLFFFSFGFSIFFVTE